MRSLTRNTSAMLLALVAVAAFACAPADKPAPETAAPAAAPAAEPAPAPLVAVATLAPGEDVKLAGTATFTQEGDQVKLVLDVEGVPAGMHGFHVHDGSECVAPDYTSAGGHFNPEGTEHACPPTLPRHAGDFGNVEVGEDGTGHLEVYVSSDLASVAPGPHSVVGHAVILHAGEDDCISQPTGAAGGRLACGIIELSGGEPAMAEPAAGDAGSGG